MGSGFVSKKMMKNPGDSDIIQERSPDSEISIANNIKRDKLANYERVNSICHVFSKSDYGKIEGIIKKKSKERQIEDKFKILFGNYRKETFFQRYFPFCDLIHQFFIVMVIILIYPECFLQIKVINIIQIAFLFVTLLIRPFNSKKQTMNFVVNEGLLTIVFISCLILAVYDDKEYYGKEERQKLGKIILVCHLSLFFWLV